MALGDKLDFNALYHSFGTPVTDFDCGQLCAPLNGGIPACCKGDEVIPVLYVGEFRRLIERTDLWEAFRPVTAHDRSLVAEHDDHQLATCRGVAHCERENRSLNCRTFPFSPYIDHDGLVAGLVYDMDAAEGKCPLVDLPQTVTRRYIVEATDFWSCLLVDSPDERRFYADECVDLRRRFGREGQPVPVLVELGIREYPTSLAGWKALDRDGQNAPLVPMERPAG